MGCRAGSTSCFPPPAHTPGPSRCVLAAQAGKPAAKWAQHWRELPEIQTAQFFVVGIFADKDATKTDPETSGLNSET